MRKWKVFLFPPLSQGELFPGDVILHFAHHKNLTAYYGSIIGQLSEEFNFFTKSFPSDYPNFERHVLSGKGKRILRLSDVSDVAFSHFPAFKGSHFVRDPRDLIISGYHYHLWTKEPWCIAPSAPKYVDWNKIAAHPYFVKYVESDPAKFPAHISYQDYLKSLDFERGMIVELIWRQFTFVEMAKWQAHPNVIELKYEEIIGNEVESFRRIFEHYEFHPRLIERGLQIVDEFSLKNRDRGEKKHVRKGAPAQWKAEFTPLLKDIFKNLNGDLLILLGYETDGNW